MVTGSISRGVLRFGHPVDSRRGADDLVAPLPFHVAAPWARSKSGPAILLGRVVPI